MRNKIIVICFLAYVHLNSSYAQIANSETLIKAQDTRKKYIGNDDSTLIVRSKSLYVNPFVGTDGHGHTYPGASAPFGMMQLSPDTRYDGWDGCSGYHYSDSIIYGFSHTHLSGTGVPDYCDLLLVPQSGKPNLIPGYLNKEGYGSKFSHNEENAEPGYYEVSLLDENIDVRLTVSDRAGMHEYHFKNQKEKKYLLIDLDHRDRVLNAAVKVLNKKSIEGFRISEGWAKEQHFYFYLETSEPIVKTQLIRKNGQNKLLLQFSKNIEYLKVKVGISAVDNFGAKNNLLIEIPDWDFNAVRASTSKKWNSELGKINFVADKDKMINFYTALYHSYLNPNIFSDQDGRYRGRDNQIHQLKNISDEQYSVFSLWDTYRATHPLFTLTQQKRTKEFVNTFLRQYDLGVDLPVWELSANETDCMIGYHSVSVIADAFIKGLTDLDTNKTIDALIHTSNLDELGKKQNARNGFINSQDEPESVSKTLEYAYDDFCISQFALLSKDFNTYSEYLKRSMNFINLYDPTTKFMRARRNGKWIYPFDPSEVNFNYTEANSWQYSLYAPHAVGILQSLLGGKDSLELWLDELFSHPTKLTGRDQVDITGLIGQYAHGNEPSHHMAYLYNYTNHPEKTQFYTDLIMKSMYSPKPEGLSGNEDCGQMSSWYVLSALGLYQIAPSNPYYEFGRPIMSEAVIQLENNKNLIIKTLNNSEENKYIQKIVYNGSELQQTFIAHHTLMDGGELIFEMGSTPSPNYRTYFTAPTVSIAPDNFLCVPYFEKSEQIFSDSIEVKINFPNYASVLTDFQIEFSTDSLTWIEYEKPFFINQTEKIYTKLKAKNINGELIESNSVSATYKKKENSTQLILKSSYDNQYAAGGPDALIDGIEGGNEFRTGDWQGFYGRNIEAIVEFDQPKILKEIGISCIQDMKSWIFYPSEIQLSYSFDGVIFIELPSIYTNFKYASNVMSPTLIPSFSSYVGPMNMDFYQNTETNKPIQKIKILAINYGKCPDWHLGAGNDTWLFSDEIIFR
jgi:predicted alpha-1,2-mannosidase